MRKRIIEASKRGGLLLSLLVAVQVLVLTGMLLSQYAISWFGKEIELKTAPVDPRDIFYGDYVILNYEISRLPLAMSDRDKLNRGDSVYVLLRPSASDRRLYEAAGISTDKPKTEGDEVYIKARVQYVWENGANEEVQLQYGLERYYVPEGTGMEWERRWNEQFQEQGDKLRVRVTVAPWGRAKVEELINEE